MVNNKIWDIDIDKGKWNSEINPENMMPWEMRPNTTLWEFSVTLFNRDENLAKARVNEVRDSLRADNLSKQIKEWVRDINPENMMPWELMDVEHAYELMSSVASSIDNFIILSEKSSEEIKKLFEEKENWSLEQKILILSIINNPKTTPEDLDYYFFKADEWTDIEFLLAKAIISHPNQTQVLFNKAYGISIQKWGNVFDLFEEADKERANRRILNGILIPLDTNSENISIDLEDIANVVWLYASEDYVPTADDKCWVSGKSFLLTLSKWSWRKAVVVYLKDKSWNIITRNFIVLLKTDDKKETKESTEKMNETMQGSILKILYGSGVWSIRWDNGKNYYFNFTDINDKGRDEDRAGIFNELLVDTKVEFKLKANKNIKGDLDGNYFEPVLWGYIERGFVATDIVVKEEKEKMENIMQGTVSKIEYEKGMGVIKWSNGKNYFLHFSGMEGKAEAFSELLVDCKVEFILTPTRGKAMDSDKMRHWSDLNKAFWMNLESDLMANNIVIKD
ncbi:MAG: hypothetical protein ACD_49C00036G0008 [uncultured bacterium (gcode 4)]|uniref:CSD domain-containing protein n=1 Tax=uncultured bacterium (gcode 4) TaxID=1234023 RepID=K2AET3_9BACT|nr:MAG: hypothetical protein ACD_49C00036G0008 [uncultured bacterium (gcode 4)]